ncbi:unannotated protein [freshwater metagenome]|uniref:Unannotated protein n=1 Tax=freshwater metagenome TaxID=449393 RepID=A0A6J7I9U7_9ZZZZ
MNGTGRNTWNKAVETQHSLGPRGHHDAAGRGKFNGAIWAEDLHIDLGRSGFGIDQYDTGDLADLRATAHEPPGGTREHAGRRRKAAAGRSLVASHLRAHEPRRKSAVAGDH